MAGNIPIQVTLTMGIICNNFYIREASSKPVIAIRYFVKIGFCLDDALTSWFKCPADMKRQTTLSSSN